MEDANDRGEKITIEREGPCKGGKAKAPPGGAVERLSNLDHPLLAPQLLTSRLNNARLLLYIQILGSPRHRTMLTCTKEKTPRCPAKLWATPSP